MKHEDMWHKWFAWKPIAFGPFIRWMCYVQRRRHHDGYWLYRRNKFEI